MYISYSSMRVVRQCCLTTSSQTTPKWRLQTDDQICILTFVQGQNAFYTSDKRFSAGDECVENVRSNCYQRLSNRSTLETVTYLQKRAVATLSYSPASKLHPQVIYAMALSAGLNGLQVD